jgi:cytochrome oxidase Cu insertion factor (SCO1/SenC/PrrC family)
MSGDLLGLAAAALVVVTGFIWFRLIGAVRIRKLRAQYVAAMGVGVALGIAAFAQGVGALGGVAATFAILAGSFFVVLRLQSGQDARQPAVKVGEPILDFTAPDDRDEPFELASMRGTPFLLKFFRGHW